MTQAPIPRIDPKIRSLNGSFRHAGRRWHNVRAPRFAFVLLAALLSFPAVLGAQAPDQPLLRWQFFYEMRAFPFQQVPAGAMQRAYRQMTARWPAIIARDAAASADAATSVWSPIGPAPIGGGFSGRISTVAVHPADSRIIYIGGAQGGVWKTTDAGASWVPLTDRECSLAMGSIAIDPVNPQILYAGTGELHFSADSYYGCGVLRSSDGGASWTQLGASVFDANLVGGARISKVLVDPATAGSTASTVVHVAASNGVWISRNSGVSWDRTLNGIGTDLVMHPTDPQILYAGLGTPGGASENGVYRTTDGGTTWTRMANGFPSSGVGRIALALAPGAPSVLYAAIMAAFGTSNGGQLLGIWKSTDAGASWTRMNASGADCATQCWYDLVIATDPLDPNIVYFGGVLLYRSDDGGITFRNIQRQIHVDQHALTFDPQNPAVVFVGNDGGIYRSPDRGGTWISLNTNLAITQFYSGISLHPTDPLIALGGTQDNGTLEYFGQSTWNQVLGGDGGFTAIDFRDPAIAYAETQWSANSGFSGPRQRIGPGPFGARKVTGIDISDRALFIPPLVMDPVDPAVLYFGTFRVYRTANRADLWTAISPDLTTGTGRVSAIAPAASEPATIYVGTSDGNVQVTRDLGTNWSLRRAGLPARALTDIAVDPTNPANAIVVFSGFNSGHVFRTTDFGVTWTDISANLPDIPVNAVIVHPDFGSDIYIGTDLGVFRSTAGTAWTPLADGFPNVAAFDLAYNTNTALIVAGTHGRGMFSFRPIVATDVIVAPDSLRLSALQDTVRLSATAFDTLGAQFPSATFSWRSLDPAVATVDASGLVRSLGNGETSIIAAFAGAADTTIVRVNQIPVALANVPDSLALVVGERFTIPGRAIDARGQPVLNSTVTWTSTNSAAATVDGAGHLTATGLGNTIVLAVLGALRDSSHVTVLAPSVAAIAASVAAPAAPPSSAAGSRVPLLRLRFTTTGIEPVEITRVGFDVSGNDQDAEVQLIRDADDDGILDADDPVITSFKVSLRPGSEQRVSLSPNGFTVPAQGAASLLIAFRMSGQAPNGTVFEAKYLPGETASIGIRSGARDQLQQSGNVVTSGPVQSTLLAADQILTFSENPVRSARVIFNFRERPTVAAVYTLTGRRVIDLTREITDDARFEWDLRNDDGNLVAPGVYLIIFNVGGAIMRERLMILRVSTDQPEAAPKTQSN
jgi:photosystem II stability/assembly factor-like uncharacterized protein